MEALSLANIEALVGQRTPRVMGTYRYYSVLVPLVEKDGELHLLYEVRSETLKKQPGEVCFPGGRMEADETARECAVRETVEEIGVPMESIRLLGELDYMYTYSNFTMYSFVGTINDTAVDDMIINRDEVKETFLVPLSYLMETEPECYYFDVIPNVGDDFPYEKINAETGYNWRKGKSVVPIYHYQDRVIWGLTARITKHLVDLLKEQK